MSDTKNLAVKLFNPHPRIRCQPLLQEPVQEPHLILSGLEEHNSALLGAVKQVSGFMVQTNADGLFTEVIFVTRVLNAVFMRYLLLAQFVTNEWEPSTPFEVRIGFPMDRSRSVTVNLTPNAAMSFLFAVHDNPLYGLVKQGFEGFNNIPGNHVVIAENTTDQVQRVTLFQSAEQFKDSDFNVRLSSYSSMNYSDVLETNDVKPIQFTEIKTVCTNKAQQPELVSVKKFTDIQTMAPFEITLQPNTKIAYFFKTPHSNEKH